MPEKPKRRCLRDAENRAITSAAKDDRDAQPLGARQLKAMVPMRSLRGRPKSEHPKQLVSVRYCQDVLAYFRSTGGGWQPWMDGVLLKYVARRSRHTQR